MDKNLTKKIYLILKETFVEANIPKEITELKIGDLKGWDSLGNFNLLLAIEEDFSIRFSMEQISGIKSVKDIILALENANG